MGVETSTAKIGHSLLQFLDVKGGKNIYEGTFLPESLHSDLEHGCLCSVYPHQKPFIQSCIMLSINTNLPCQETDDRVDHAKILAYLCTL